MRGTEDNDGRRAYGALAGKRVLWVALLAVLLAAAGLVSLAVGGSAAGLRDVLRSGLDGVIFWDIRLPRVVMGLLVGFGLAVGGAVTQAVLRNPLASPFTLGVASGAGFGAALGIVLVSGMTIGTLFTLLVIPSIYVLIAKQHAGERLTPKTGELLFF